MKLFIGTDHGGLARKDEIVFYLKNQGMDVEEGKLPNYPTDDYPDFAFEISELVRKTPDSLGILFCTNGIGVSIAANKVKKIRCARVFDMDDAFKAKNHDGANVIAMGMNISLEETKNIVDLFIATKKVSEERHLRRISKIIKYEEET